MKFLRNLLEKKTESWDYEKHFKNRAMGIMSAEREGLSPEENASRTNALEKDLKAAGHHVVHSNGVYVHDFGTPQAHSTAERSFIVSHKKTGNDNGAVRNTLTNLGQKYEQDSVLHKPHNSDIAVLIGTHERSQFPKKGAVEPIGKLAPGKKAENHTRLMDDRVFTFEGYIENCLKQII